MFPVFQFNSIKLLRFLGILFFFFFFWHLWQAESGKQDRSAYIKNALNRRYTLFNIAIKKIRQIVKSNASYRLISARNRPAAVVGGGSGQLPTASSTSSKKVVLL